jgi:hypothetical protein
MWNVKVREVVHPELVPGMFNDLAKGFPSRADWTVQSQAHVHAQQRSLGNRTGCEAIMTMPAEPALGGLVVDVGIDPQRNEKIAIQQPGHQSRPNARSSSAASICSTSRDVISRLPADVGNLDCALFRRASFGVSGRVCTARRTNRLIASAIEMRSLSAKASATV